MIIGNRRPKLTLNDDVGDTSERQSNSFARASYSLRVCETDGDRIQPTFQRHSPYPGWFCCYQRRDTYSSLSCSMSQSTVSCIGKVRNGIVSCAVRDAQAGVALATSSINGHLSSVTVRACPGLARLAVGGTIFQKQ